MKRSKWNEKRNGALCLHFVFGAFGFPFFENVTHPLKDKRHGDFIGKTSSPNDGRNVWEIFRNVASLNVLIHDVINLLYYEHWTHKRKYFYI